MKDTIRNKCDLFADNYYELKKKFMWEGAINQRLGALLYSMENRSVNSEAIGRCHKIIKENTGIFSEFKSTTYFMISVLLSLQSEPEMILKNSINIYNTMKKEGFHSSPYLVLAAIQVSLRAETKDYRPIIVSAKSFYDAMKKEHWFITSADDYGFATLLAMSDKTVSMSIGEMENCYSILKESFAYSNVVQSLSHILLFSEENSPAKCKRVVDLYQALKDRKCKIGSSNYLSFLGVLVLLGEDTNTLADVISETNEYLKTKKGISYWSIDPKERLMYAIAIVSDDYLEKVKKNTLELTLESNVAAIIMAQEMATIAAVSAAAAASAASN